MRISKTLATVALVPVLLAPLGPADAQDTPESRAGGWAVAKIVGLPGAPGDPEQIRESMRKLFRSADFDGGGVSDNDYLLRERMRAARSRAAGISGIMTLDIDGDGAVSREEVETQMRPKARAPMPADGVMLEPMPEQVRQRLEALVARTLQHDGNGDGVIEFSEMMAAVNSTAPQPDPPPDHRRSIPSYLDEDGDGVVTMDEFSAIVDRAIETVDGDGDGILSQAEIAAARERGREFARREAEARIAHERARRKEEQVRKLTESCALPGAPAEARALLLVAYEGVALSTASLGGDDEEVQVIDVRIEAGDRPLYVVVSSYHAIIWRFSGAVERVVALVADSQQRARDGKARTGVAGIPADRIHFPATRGCTPGYGERRKADKSKIETLERLIGSGLDDVVVHYGVGQASLPDGAIKEKHAYPGRVTPPKGTAGAPFWREMLRFNPGGLVRIEAELVVSTLPVRPYEVLPQEAGLAQLLDEGALAPYGKAKAELMEAIEDSPELDRYPLSFVLHRSLLVIQRKVAYPAGLAGAHSVTFILPPGVPEPDGMPGHSPVIRPSAEIE